MKRKRAHELVETSQEIIKVKKQRSQIKNNESDDDFRLDPDFQLPGELRSKNPRKKGTKNKSPNKDVGSPDLPESGTSASTDITKRKKKHKSDINQNGEVGEREESADHSENPSSTIKKRKKNGFQNRATSDSPSDFQPLGHFLKKDSDVKEEEDLHLEEEENVIKDELEVLTPIKKKRGRKPKVRQEESSLKGNFKTGSPSLKHGVLKNTNKKEAEESFQPDDPVITPDTDRVKPKKKVRIDETESLKVKRELAGTEPHFSTKQLPAKIIKSKLNKSLTEEVKVSPITVQSSKKAKKTIKNIKMDHDVEEEVEKTIIHKQLREQHLGNGLSHEPSIASDESDLEVYYINKNAEKEARKNSLKKHSILMSKEDQLILVQRMQDVIPDDDTKSYKYRLQNLEWQNVAFKNYSLEECQKVWTQLLKKVRHYRLLIEITHDVKQVIELNDMQAGKTGKTKSGKKHPDMPKRPLTSYFLYYIRERDKIGKERPDLDTVELNKYISEKYQNLPLEKKQKYELLAAKNREIYKQKLEEFYAKHPEMRKVVTKKERKERKEKPPKRPENPYRLFVQAELNREEIAEEDKAEFKEVCREKWLQMSDSKKLGWINLAEEHHKKYEEELKEYMARHPEYTPKSQAHKSFLSRQEINLKDKLAGKPKKPPGSAYGLFISMTMQSSEIVDIPPRERWNYTSTRWKAMGDEERDQYKQLLAQVHEQYQKDFKIYLDSLPEEKRQAELLATLPKKRKTAAIEKASARGAKRKAKSTRSASTKAKNTKQKIQNPTPPPRSAYKYFAEKYEGENPKEAWKNLSTAEKDKYEEELIAIKGKYIKEFEIYLKSLTKEELAEFCANRSSQEEYSSSDDSDSESDHGDEESSDDDSSDNSDYENDTDEN